MTIWVIKWSGYDATVEDMSYWVQDSVDVYRKVFALYAAGNWLPTIVNMIPLFFYDLDGQKKINMYKALNERRMLIAKENQGKLSEDMSLLIDQLKKENVE